MPPKRATKASTNASQPAERDRSAEKNAHSPGKAAISAGGSLRMPLIPTLAPCWANRAAVANPIPAVEPVINTRLLVKSENMV
ncbi:hypothetical protein D3C80_1918250 [compost metagenome]